MVNNMTTTDLNFSDTHKTNSQITAFLKHIECPVCYQHSDSPIMTCKNGHVLCNPCNLQIINQDTRKRQSGWCPTCKEYGMTRNLPLENIIREQLEDQLIFECRFKHLGCKTICSFGNLNNHVNHCPYNMDIYSCPFCNFQTPMNRYTLVNHIIDDMVGDNGDSTLRLTLIPIRTDIDLLATVDTYLSSFLDTNTWTIKRRKIEIQSQTEQKYATEFLLKDRDWEPDECMSITIFDGLDISERKLSDLTNLCEDGKIYTNNITLLFDYRQIYMFHFAANTLPASVKYTAGFLNPHTTPTDQQLFGVRLMLDKISKSTQDTSESLTPDSDKILQKQHIIHTITINHVFTHLQYTQDDDTGFYHRFKNMIITDKICSPSGHHTVAWQLIHY